MEIRTERLILRPWRVSDVDDLFECAKDPSVGPDAGWPPHRDREESLSVIENVLNGDECYAICLLGKPIGAIELISPVRCNLPITTGGLELGYWLGKEYWGNGYMFEAATAVLEHAFKDLGVGKVYCGCFETNKRSENLIKKLGFLPYKVGEELPRQSIVGTRRGTVYAMSAEYWCVNHQ